MTRDSDDPIRLEVLLARSGIGSRRACAQLIRDGRVSVDNLVVNTPGLRMSPASGIEIDGRPVSTLPERSRAIIAYKPRGYICSKRRQSSQTRLLYDLIPDIEERVVSVGRLDKESEGLIVLTNDGALTHALTHPRFNHSKTYAVTVEGTVSERQLYNLTQCRQLDSDSIRPVSVSVTDSCGQETELEFILYEGKNRQIRRMCKLFGLTILRLQRVAIGKFRDPSLACASWRDLSPEEVQLLLA